MISHDGLEWPLETFLDAYGYIRTNGEPPDFADATGQIDVVTISGELRSGLELDAVPWHEVAAVNIADNMRLDHCPGCGAWIVPVRFSTDSKGRTVTTTDICKSCDEDCY